MVTSREKPTRLEALKYYRRAAERYDLPLNLYERVEEVGRKNGHFHVRTTPRVGEARSYSARRVIVATGFQVPVPGKENLAGVLKKVPVSGGTVLTLCECDNPSFFGRMWGTDQRIYFDTWRGVSWIPATGGEPQPVTVAQEGERRSWADLLPDGDSLLITVKPRNTEWVDRSDIGIVSLQTGDYRPLLEGAGHFARYVPTGHLVYAREGELRAVPFDPRRLEVTGPPVSVLEASLQMQLPVRRSLRFLTTGRSPMFPAIESTRLQLGSSGWIVMDRLSPSVR